MSDHTEKLNKIRACIIHDDPWTSGTLEVPENSLKLYYSEKSSPKSSRALFLNSSASAEELFSLSSACDAATFGRGGEDVMDESYRKAGKLDTTLFSTPFDARDTPVIERVMSKLFSGPWVDKPVTAELYKLNVYGPGAFFRSHRDTPRGEKMFGSLVIVFPTIHQGGSLALRHDEKEFIFDSSHLVSDGTNKIAYVAFFSDVEHEVLPVVSGYRVTLTYNLYHATPSANLRTRIPTGIEEVINLRNSISSLLDDPTFLPDGGILGFGLNFCYPVKIGNRLAFEIPTSSWMHALTSDYAFPSEEASYRMMTMRGKTAA